MPTAYEIWEAKQKNNNIKPKTAYEMWEDKRASKWQPDVKNDKVLLTKEAIGSVQQGFKNVSALANQIGQAKPNAVIKPAPKIPLNTSISEIKMANLGRERTLKDIIGKKDKPSIGDTLFYNTIAGVSDAAKGYANIPILAEKLVGQGINATKNIADVLKYNIETQPRTKAEQFTRKPFVAKERKELPLSPQTQSLENMVNRIETNQAAIDELNAKAPKLQQYLGMGIRSAVAAAPALATGNVVGSAPTMFGVQFGSNYARDAEKEGATPLQSAAYGSIMGAVESLSGKYLDNILKGVGGKKALITALKNINSEGLQEVVSNPISAISKRAIYGNDKDPIVNLKRELDSYVGGVLTAGMFAGGAGLINKVGVPKTARQTVQGVPTDTARMVEPEIVNKLNAEVEPIVQDVTQTPNKPQIATQPERITTKTLPENVGVEEVKKSVNEVPNIEPKQVKQQKVNAETENVITVPVVIGKNKTRGKSVGTMIDSDNDISFESQQKLTNVLKEVAKENGVEPTPEWVTNSISNLLKSHQQSIENGSNAFVGELPNGKKIVLANQNVLDKVDFSKELSPTPVQPEPNNLTIKNELQNEEIRIHQGGDNFFDVYKNPTDEQYKSLIDKYREEYPGAPPGEPKTRKTFDKEGNVYYWMSGDATHSTVESQLKKLKGVETNQNKMFEEETKTQTPTENEVIQNGLQGQEEQGKTEINRPSGQELGIIAKPKLPFLKQVEPRAKTMVINEVSEVSPTINKIVTNKKGRMPMKTLWDNFYQKFVNNQHYIGLAQKTAGQVPANKDMAIMAANSRNAPGTVNHILREALVTKEGKEIGNSYKTIIDSVPRKHEQEFNDYLLHRHNIGRMAQEKPVFGNNVTPEMSEQQIAKYEAKFPDFKRIADQYDSFNQKFMKEWAVKTGLVSEDTMKHLNEIYPHYTPTYRTMEEAAATQIRPGKGFVNQPNILKKATGSERPILNPLETTMQLVDKTVKTAKYNEVGQTIVDAIRKDPEGMKEWGEIVKDPGTDLVSDTGKTLENGDIGEVMDNFVSQYEKPKLSGKNIVRVMENGQPVYLKINKPEFLESITGLINYKPGEAEKIARMVTTPYKALITGKNPIFAVKNIARDIPTAYINGSEKNPFKFIRNLSEAAKDMATNAESYREYKALGGGNSGFFLEGKGKTSNLKKLYKGEGPVSQFNESIESLPRYAEYKRTVKRGGGDYASKMQGLFNANELTVNFSRHGNVIKSIDAVVPYLNPSVQGLDKLARQFQKNPLATVGKGILIVTIPQIALNLINRDNDEYKKLDNRTKDNYYLIPNVADGGETFIKIPKSREYGVIFADTFDRIQRGLKGEQRAFDGYLDTVAINFAPTNPLESNYLSPIITNLPSNKDFAGRTIVPQGIQSRSPKYQYDENTSEISKAIGQRLNVSPKQADYLIKSYTGVIGTFTLPMTTKSSKGTIQQIIGNTVSRNFTADPVFSNDIVNRFYEQKKKAETVKADAKFNNKELSITEDNKRHQYNVAAEEISKIYDQIRTAKSDEEKRNLRKQINDIAKIATESSVDDEVKETKNDVLEKLGIEPESKQKFY